MSNSEEKCMTPEGAMKVLKIIGMVLLGIAAVFVFGWVTQLLWNWLMPKLFELPTVTYWEGLGVIVLTSILFGRLGGGSSDSKKKEKKSRPIRDEIRREFAKEFDKEYGKKTDDKEDAECEKIYEKWWEAEGRVSFEKYSKGDSDSGK